MSRLLAFLAPALLLSAGAFAQTEHADHDHDHAPGTEHAGEGPAHLLGHVDIAGRTLAVTSYGEVQPGAEAAIGIVVEHGQPPAELRSWIGVRNGRGSVKQLLRAEHNGAFHGHLEVPQPLPQDSAVWLELVTDAGRPRAHLALPADDHTHAAVEGHVHDASSPGERR